MQTKPSYALPQRRLVSQEDSAIIQRPNVPRSVFLNQFQVLTTIQAPILTPFLCQEVLPGDHLTYDVVAYVRMATPLYPIFSNQRVDTFFFFVPNRLVWKNWVKFMGQQDSPGDSISYTIPQIVSPADGYLENSLYDYFGLPIKGQIAATKTITHSALPIRAYALIYNTWFRDENITNATSFSDGDGPDTYSNYGILQRAKQHDYFTSCLPWPQKFTAPSTPLGGTAPVTGIGWDTTGASHSGTQTVWETGITGSGVNYSYWGTTAVADKWIFKTTITGEPQIFADLSRATGVSINIFRQAFLIQELLERDARGGTRYTELIKSHFGVTNPDFRLQRPEYIGGGQTPMNITPIAQTTPTAGSAYFGSVSGAGTGVGSHRASYAATEHGYIIGIINIRTEQGYQQGLERHWSRATRYDYYFPTFAGLGEQAVLRKELYCTGDSTNDESVFGYQERWQELRTCYNTTRGFFRSQHTTPLDAWHLYYKYTSAPTLSTGFIWDDPPMDRVLAAGSAANYQQFLCDIQINRRAVRPLPAFGTPVTLGRF